MRETLSGAAFLAFLISSSACSPAARAVELVGEPVHYRGRVVAARGPTMARTGGTCTVEVQGADGAYLNCRIRVRCSDDLVYGLSGAGYNNCRRNEGQFVFANDHNGTRRDGDPRMFFDLSAGRLIISDDDPDVEVLVDLMIRPPGYGGAESGGGPDDAEPEEGETSGGESVDLGAPGDDPGAVN